MVLYPALLRQKGVGCVISAVVDVDLVEVQLSLDFLEFVGRGINESWLDKVVDRKRHGYRSYFLYFDERTLLFGFSLLEDKQHDGK